MNGIDNRSNVYAKRLMRLQLADLNESAKIGAGMSGDDQRIKMIRGLLEQWDMDVPSEESAAPTTGTLVKSPAFRDASRPEARPIGRRGNVIDMQNAPDSRGGKRSGACAVVSYL